METSRTSDVGTSPFEPWPVDAQVHVEWGPPGARLASMRGDIVVIVDVLAFSTSVVLTATRGGTALSYSAAELEEMGGRERAAALLGAEVVAKDRAATTARFSLSPASLAKISRGDRLIFTSLNGAACTSAAAPAPVVIVGALTNASATARTIRGLLDAGVAARCTVVACGERWTSVSDEPDSLRPSIEDLLGAGAIVAALQGLRTSPEAALAAASYRELQDEIGDVLRRCVSGRELIDRGFPDDVEIAAAVDSSEAVPVWRTSDPVREFKHNDGPERQIPLARCP
jgi:2-phosphosulfolactate phosphatase